MDSGEEIGNNVNVGRFVSHLPGIRWVSSKVAENGWWYVKFSLDLNTKSSWHVVQGLAYVLNNLSLNESLPTVFFPTSSPPDMNGGPNDHLYWVIEPRNNDVDPSDILAALYSTFEFEVDSEEGWISWSAQ